MNTQYIPDSLLMPSALWEERNRTAQSQRNALIDQLFMVNDPELEKTALGEMLGGLLDRSAAGVGSVVNKLNQNHDSAEKRYDSLLTYVDTHYPAAPAPALEVTNWQAISKTRKVEQIWQGLLGVVEARDALAQRKPADAEKLMKSAVNPHTTHQNFLRQSFYELRTAQRKTEAMQQNLALGMKGAYPSLSLHVESARLAGETNPATARKLLTTFDQYGRPPTYYHHVIAMAESSGLKVDALALIAECTAKYMGEGVSCGDAQAAAKSNLSYGSLLQSLAP